MLEKTEENIGSKPDKVLADAGYKSEENSQRLRDQKIEAYVSLGRGEKASKKAQRRVTPPRGPWRKLSSARTGVGLSDRVSADRDPGR